MHSSICMAAGMTQRGLRIHLSHQNLTSYFNPQQVPLAVWSLLKSYLVLKARHDDDFSEYERRLLEEGLYGYPLWS
jgi:hypothetical protein